MKIEQTECEFNPIHITIESKTEAALLAVCIGPTCSNGRCSAVKDKYNIDCPPSGVADDSISILFNKLNDVAEEK